MVGKFVNVLEEWSGKVGGINRFLFRGFNIIGI